LDFLDLFIEVLSAISMPSENISAATKNMTAMNAFKRSMMFEFVLQS
jgi:hypothetical protein